MTVGGPPGIIMSSLQECLKKFGHPRDWNKPVVTDWFKRRVRAILASDADLVAKIDAERASREPGDDDGD